MELNNDAHMGEWLLNEWEQAKEKGLSLLEFAQSLGLTRNQVRGRIDRARHLARDSAIPAGGIKTEIKQNYMTLETGFNRRIMSLEDLLEAAKVNLDEWVVDRYLVNKWEVGAKTAKKELQWEAGQIIGGYIKDEGELTIEPLIQVKAWLIKKDPIALSPIIQPVSIVVKKSKKIQEAASPGEWQKALILPDIQFGFSRNERGIYEPYHSRAALDLALQVAQADNFDRLVFLGDVLDLPEFSDKYIRQPEFYFNTQAAILEGAWWLSQFRLAQPAADIDILEGNHDKRMRDALARHLVHAFSLRPATELDLPPSLSIERLLSLESISAKWVGDYPNGAVWLNDEVECIHGEISRNPPGGTAAAMIANTNHSTIFGHIHRIERLSRTIPDRKGYKNIMTVSPGCLCRVDYAVPGHSKGTGQTGWQQGLAVVNYKPAGDHFIDVIEIVGDKLLYNGSTFRARDNIHEIRKQTGWRL